MKALLEIFKVSVWERVGIVIEKVSRGHGKGGIVVPGDFAGVIYSEYSELSLGGWESPIAWVLYEGKAMIDGDAEIRNGINILLWAAKNWDPILAGLILIGIDSIYSYDGHFIDGDKDLIETRAKLCVSETEKSVAIIRYKWVIGNCEGAARTQDSSRIVANYCVIVISKRFDLQLACLWVESQSKMS